MYPAPCNHRNENNIVYVLLKANVTQLTYYQRPSPPTNYKIQTNVSLLAHFDGRAMLKKKTPPLTLQNTFWYQEVGHIPGYCLVDRRATL